MLQAHYQSQCLYQAAEKLAPQRCFERARLLAAPQVSSIIAALAAEDDFGAKWSFSAASKFQIAGFPEWMLNG
jgi:hypothetical protein